MLDKQAEVIRRTVCAGLEGDGGTEHMEAADEDSSICHYCIIISWDAFSVWLMRPDVAGRTEAISTMTNVVTPTRKGAPRSGNLPLLQQPADLLRPKLANLVARVAALPRRNIGSRPCRRQLHFHPSTTLTTILRLAWPSQGPSGQALSLHGSRAQASTTCPVTFCRSGLSTSIAEVCPPTRTQW